MSNDKGTWYGWDVTKVGPVEKKEVYELSKNFAAQISKGKVKVKHGTEETSSTPY